MCHELNTDSTHLHPESESSLADLKVVRRDLYSLQQTIVCGYPSNSNTLSCGIIRNLTTTANYIINDHHTAQKAAEIILEEKV